MSKSGDLKDVKELPRQSLSGRRSDWRSRGNLTVAYQMSVKSLGMIRRESILKCNNDENTHFHFFILKANFNMFAVHDYLP